MNTSGESEMVSYEEARFYILKLKKDEPAYSSAPSFRKALCNFGLSKTLPPDLNDRKKGFIALSILPEVAQSTGKRYNPGGKIGADSEAEAAAGPVVVAEQSPKEHEAQDNSAIERFSRPVDGETSPFDRIRHVESDGVEWWDARELQAVLGYEDWKNFTPIIAKARQSMDVPGRQLADHFSECGKMVELGSGAQREIESFRLSREACYAIAMEGDGSKPQIQSAKQYFRIQTRRMELTDAGLSAEERMSEITSMSSGMIADLVDGLKPVFAEALETQVQQNANTLETIKTFAEQIQKAFEETLGDFMKKLQADEARKRNNFRLSQKREIGRLFYQYTGDGCDLLDYTPIIDKDGNPIKGAVEFDHIDNDSNDRSLTNCVPLSVLTHKRKTNKKLTAEEEQTINGWKSYVKLHQRKKSETEGVQPSLFPGCGA